MIILEVIFLLIFWTAALSGILFLYHTFLPRSPITDTSLTSDLPLETVRFQATDGVELEGWKIFSDSASPWILLCPGMGTNRSSLLDIAAGLHQASFNVFLFDFRGHGGSKGCVTSFGWRERHDLEGALTFLGQQPEIPAKSYGIYGTSMGAAVALMVAGLDERLRVLAVDSPYSNLQDSLAHHLTLMYPVPQVPFIWFVLAAYRLRFGIWPKKVSPVASVANMCARPILLIQGDQDSRTPLKEMSRLFDAAKSPKELWVVKGVDHLKSYEADPQRYLNRLIEFFRASLCAR